MRTIKIITAVLVAAAFAILAVSCDKENGKDSTVTVTYAVTSFSFDNGTASDASALRSELDSYCKSSENKQIDAVKSGAQAIVGKYTQGKSYSYNITVNSYKNGKETGMFILNETRKMQ